MANDLRTALNKKYKPKKQSVLEVAAKGQGGHEATKVALKKKPGSVESAKNLASILADKAKTRLPRAIIGLATGSTDPLGIVTGEGAGVDPLTPLESALAKKSSKEKDYNTGDFKFVSKPNRSGGAITPFPHISQEQMDKMHEDPSFRRASKQVYWAARGIVSPIERQVMGTVSSALSYEKRKEAKLNKVSSPILRQGIKSAVESVESIAMGGTPFRGVGMFQPGEEREQILDKLIDHLDPYKHGFVTPWAMERKAQRQLAAEERGDVQGVWNSMIETSADFAGLVTNIRLGKALMGSQFGLEKSDAMKAFALDGAYGKYALEQAKHVGFAGMMAFFDAPQTGETGWVDDKGTYHDGTEPKSANYYKNKPFQKVIDEAGPDVTRLANAVIRMAYMATPIAARKLAGLAVPKGIISKEILSRGIDFVQNSMLSYGLVYRHILKETDGKLNWEFFKQAAPSITWDALMAATTGANWQQNKSLWRSANYKHYQAARDSGAKWANEITFEKYQTNQEDGVKRWGEFLTKKLKLDGDVEKVKRDLGAVNVSTPVVGGKVIVENFLPSEKYSGRPLLDESGEPLIGSDGKPIVPGGERAVIERSLEDKAPGGVRENVDRVDAERAALGRSRIVSAFDEIAPKAGITLERFTNEFPRDLQDSMYKVLSQSDPFARQNDFINLILSEETNIRYLDGATDARDQMVFYGARLKAMTMEQLVIQLEIDHRSPVGLQFYKTGVPLSKTDPFVDANKMKTTFNRILEQNTKKDLAPWLSKHMDPKTLGTSRSKPNREVVENTKEELGFILGVDPRGGLTRSWVENPPGLIERQFSIFQLAGFSETELVRFLDIRRDGKGGKYGSESLFFNGEMARNQVIQAMSGNRTDIQAARELRDQYYRMVEKNNPNNAGIWGSLYKGTVLVKEGLRWHKDSETGRYFIDVDPKSTLGKSEVIEEGQRAGLNIEEELTLDPRTKAKLRDKHKTGNIRVNGRTLSKVDAETQIKNFLRDNKKKGYPAVVLDASGRAKNYSPLDDLADIVMPPGYGDYVTPRRYTTTLQNYVNNWVRNAKAYIGQNRNFIDNEVIVIDGNEKVVNGVAGYDTYGAGSGGKENPTFVSKDELPIKGPAAWRVYHRNPATPRNERFIGKMLVGPRGTIWMNEKEMSSYYKDYIDGKSTPIPNEKGMTPLSKEQFFQAIAMHEFAHRVTRMGGTEVAEAMMTITALQMIGRNDLSRLLQGRLTDPGDKVQSVPIVIGSRERGTGNEYLDKEILRTQQDNPGDFRDLSSSEAGELHARKVSLEEEEFGEEAFGGRKAEEVIRLLAADIYDIHLTENPVTKPESLQMARDMWRDDAENPSKNPLLKKWVNEFKDDGFGETRNTSDRVKDAIVGALKARGISDFMTPNGEKVNVAGLDLQTIQLFVRNSNQVPTSVAKEVFEMAKFYLASDPVKGESIPNAALRSEVESVVGEASDGARSLPTSYDVFGLSTGKGRISGGNPKDAIRDELQGPKTKGGNRTGGLKQELVDAIANNDKLGAERIIEGGYRHIHRCIGKFVGPSEKIGTAPPAMIDKMWNERKALTNIAKVAFGQEWVDKLEKTWGADYFAARQLAIRWKNKLSDIPKSQTEARKTVNDINNADFESLARRVDPKYKDALLKERDRVWDKMTKFEQAGTKQSGIKKEDFFGAGAGKAVSPIDSPDFATQEFNVLQKAYSGLLRAFGANRKDLESSETFKKIGRWIRTTPEEMVNVRQEVVGMMMDMKHMDQYNQALGSRAMDIILMQMYEHDLKMYPGERSLEGEPGKVRQARIKRMNKLLPYVMEEIHSNPGDKYGQYALSDTGRKRAWTSPEQRKIYWKKYVEMRLGGYEDVLDKEGKIVEGKRGEWIPGLTPDWKPTLTDMKNFAKERPEETFTSLAPTDMLNLAIWMKANVFNEMLNQMVSAGVLDNSNLYKNVKRGFMAREWDRNAYEKGLSLSSYSNAVADPSPEAQKWETYAEFVKHTRDKGLYVAEDFAMSTAAYVFESAGRSYRQANIIEPLKKLQNPQDPTLKLIEYTEDHSDKKPSAEKFLGQDRNYSKFPTAPGFADFEKGGYKVPWVHNSIKEIIDKFTTGTDSKGNPAVAVGEAILLMNGIVKRNVMFSPNLFYLQIASTPLQWIPMKQRFTELGRIASGEAITEGLASGSRRAAGQVESEFSHLQQNKGIDPNTYDELSRAGLRGQHIRGDIMKALWDKGQTLKHPVLQNAHDRQMEWLGSKGGVDQYVFTNMVGNVMYQFGDYMTRVFEKKGIPRERSLKLAAQFANDTTGMLDPAIYGQEGKLLQMGLFARDFTMSFMRMSTGALGLGPSDTLGGKILKKTGLGGSYQLGKRSILNSLLHGEKTKADFDALVPMYRLHLAKCFYNKWMITNMLQYGLSHLNEDPEERGVWAWQNPPGLRFSVRLPSSVAGINLLSPDHRWVHMGMLMMREADAMADNLSSLPGLREALGGRGTRDWLKSKLSWGVNIMGAQLSEADYMNKPISGDSEVARIWERSKDWAKFYQSSMVPTFMRSDVKNPIGGQMGTFVGQAGGMPFRTGAWKEEGVTWQEIQENQRRVKKEKYERQQRGRKTYGASEEELSAWYVDGQPVRRAYERSLYNNMAMPYTFWQDQNKGTIEKQKQLEWERAVDKMEKEGTL